MDFLTGVDEEFEPKRNKVVRAVAANAKLRVWLTITIVILILGIVAVVSTYSSISTKIEAKLRDEFDEQIVSLQDEVDKNKEKHQKDLEKQKETYEKKISKADENHKKEIEKKDQKIEDLEEKIREYEILDKISFDEIETQIQTVGKLTTIDYHYTYAGTHEDTLKFFNLEIGITKNSFIAQWDGVVALGVDMSKVKISVNETTKVVTISVPEAEIFYHDVDEESFEVLDEKNNIFNPISTTDKINFDIKYENKIYEKIEDNRLLEDAFENAQTMIENILNAVPEIAEQYTIKFQKIK